MSVAMTAAIWQLKLPPTMKMVLLRLGDYVNREGTSAWPSVELLAHECSINRRTVQRSLRDLEAAGLIVAQTETRGYYRSVVYELHPERGDKLPPLTRTEGAAHDRLEGRRTTALGAAMTTRRGGTTPPKPYRTGRTNRKVEPNPLTPKGGIPPVSPLRVERAKNGSNRKRDIQAYEAAEGTVYFRGKYGQVIKARIDAELAQQSDPPLHARGVGR